MIRIVLCPGLSHFFVSQKFLLAPSQVTQVDGQNVGDENVNVELDGVRHDAGVYRRSVFIAADAGEGAGSHRHWRTLGDFLFDGYDR